MTLNSKDNLTCDRGDSMNLTDSVTRWITARSLNRAPSTISGYNRLCRLYIAPTAVGAVEVADLTDTHMIALLSPLIDRGCTRQAQLLQTLVSATLKAAVRRQELNHNPMDEVERVQHHSRVTPWLSVEQARLLLSSSAQAGDPYYLAWLLMLCCGLRRGEVLALRWTDIDEDRQLLHIQRQRVTVDRRPLITRPKSATSVRDIPLDDHLLSILRLHRGAGEDVLPTCTPSKLAEGLDRALARADLPRVTPHGLRHTMAAVAAGDGVPVKVLQSLMGHAHYQTTADIYAHVDQAPRISAAKLISHTLISTRLEIV